MRAVDVMKTDVKCLNADRTVAEAARLMRDEGIGFVPICTDDGTKLIGTLTDRDLALRVVADELIAGEIKVSDVMTPEVVFGKPDDDLRSIEELMASHHKSRIPILDTTGQVCGVISLSDVAERDEGLASARTMREVASRETRPS